MELVLWNDGSTCGGTAAPPHRNIHEWLLFKISEEDCQNLLQIIDRRTARHSTIVLSQFRPDEWISQMPIQVAAEAITDRLIAQAIEIVVESKESMRKQEH